jgi:hypothetical protein
MIIDPEQPVVYFFTPRFGKIIGSLNAYKIQQMINRAYGPLSVHRDVLNCPLSVFNETLEGALHNFEWLG